MLPFVLFVNDVNRIFVYIYIYIHTVFEVSRSLYAYIQNIYIYIHMFF